MLNETIEVFGLCGAGKTTIMREFVSLLNTKVSCANIKVSPPIVPGSIQSIYETLKIEIKAFKASPLKLLNFHRSRKSWWLSRKLGFRSSAIKERRMQQKILLTDGGILQPFVSFCIEQNCLLEELPFNEYFSTLSLPSYVIYVKTSPQMAMDRYKVREKKKGKTFINNKFEERFERAFVLCEKINKQCNMQGVKSFVINADKHVCEKTLTHLLDNLLNYEMESK